VRIHERAVGDDLISRLQAHEITQNERIDRGSPRLAVAHDGRGRGDERCQSVERPLRPYLLDDPDSRVRDEDAEEECIPPVAPDQRDRPEDEQDQIEDDETFARTMLAYERLVGGGSRGPLSASRRAASASERPTVAGGSGCSGLESAASSVADRSLVVIANGAGVEPGSARARSPEPYEHGRCGHTALR
jgi:hypothetical protein